MAVRGTCAPADRDLDWVLVKPAVPALLSQAGRLPGGSTLHISASSTNVAEDLEQGSPEAAEEQSTGLFSAVLGRFHSCVPARSLSELRYLDHLAVLAAVQ